MKLHSFQELVTRIVHLSTRDGRNLAISWSGTDAYTNDRTMNLPALPAGTVLTPHQFSIWLGYTLHEGPGHQTHTDFKIYKVACETRNNPQFSYLLNLLEDIRIENADIARYPGDRRYLDSVHQFVDDQIPIETCKNPDQIALIYKHLFVTYRNLDTHRVEGQLFNGPIIQILRKLPLCISTQDCVALADELLPLLEQQNQDQDQQDQSQDQQKDQRAEGPRESNATSAEGQDQLDENQADESQPQLGSDSVNNQQKGQPQGQRDQNQAVREWQDLTEIKNILKRLEDEVKNSNREAVPGGQHEHRGTAIFPPVDISRDRIFVPSGENLESYNQTRRDLSQQILSLKKMFRIYLQSRAKKAWLRGLDEGSSLDRERLYIASTGATTIFRERHEKTLTNTAISLMLDLSGSMDQDLVKSAAIALAEALSTIPQIKLSICGFSARFGTSSCNSSPNSGRQNPMDILQFKDFSEQYLKCRAKLGAIYTDGGTPLGDAYGKALESLIPRNEPRRVIFLLTDGKPEFVCGANHSDYLLMDQIHLRARRLEIETLGLGIGDSVSVMLEKYVDQCAQVRDLNQLPQELMRVLRQIIR